MYKNREGVVLPWDFKIKIEGKRIQLSSHVKYLGVLIDSGLKWGYHIETLSTKLSRAIGMLSKIRYYVDHNTLKMIYHGIFSSLMGYSSQIWGQSSSISSKITRQGYKNNEFCWQ